MENANPPPIFQTPSRHQLETNVENILDSVRHQFDPLLHEVASITRMNRDFWRKLPHPSQQKKFEGIVLNFMHDQEDELQQLKKYMDDIDDEFMYLMYLANMTIEMFEEKIRAQKRSTYVGETLRKSDQMHQTFDKSFIEMTPKLDDMIELPKSRPKRTYKEELEFDIAMVKMVNCISYDKPIGGLDVYTPPVTYPEEEDETIRIPMEVEPLNQTQLEDLGLNTCSHDLFPSSREFPSVDELEPQPLLDLPSLGVNLGDKRGPKPPIKPHSPGSFRMKERTNGNLNARIIEEIKTFLSRPWRRRLDFPDGFPSPVK
ncbi:hypothetical protein Tco_0083679 [Tanacetum coccineum]